MTANEGLRDINPSGGTASTSTCATTPSSATNYCVPGYLAGTPYFGRDINGDGDKLDTVSVLAPSQTQTHRFGVIAGLRYEIDEHNTIRLNYTYDRARHRQTGEVGLLQANGTPVDVFPVNDGELGASGALLEKRDRLSYAILNQVSAEYRGEFLDEKLTITAGVRAPFFKRDLTNNCFTSSAGGFVECFGSDSTAAAQAALLNPYSATTNSTTGAITVSGWATPQHRVLNYKKVLPNIGFVYDVTENASVFGNFSQGLSVPGTDNLYNAFYFPLTTARARPAAETTNNFDLGMRYRSGMIQAQVSAYYNQFHNRLASAYDPEINQTVYRNLGDVKKYGIDGSIAIQPVDNFSLYVFGGVMRSKIKDNVAIGENLDGTPIYALTAGKRESGAPKYSFGVTARANIGPFELGITAKRTGERYVYDTNEAVFIGSFIPNGAKGCTGTPLTCVTPVLTTAQTNATKQVFGATAPAYWLVNLDARVSLEGLGLGDSYVQLNVYNLFDTLYVGGFGGNLNQNLTYCTATSTSSTNACYQAPPGTATYGSVPNVQIGAPRTISTSVVFKF